MIIIEAIVFLLIMYLLLGVSTYAYAVVKTYELTSTWSFRLKDGYIGIFKYPRWLLWWMECVEVVLVLIEKVL